MKVLSPEDAATLCDCSPATLERYRKDLCGPNFIRTPGGHIKYLEEDVTEWLRSLRQLPTDAQKMQAAMSEGRKGVREVNAQRLAQSQALDKADYIPDADKVIDGVTPLTMGFAGQAPGMVRCDPMTGKPIVAQTTVRDISGRSDVTVAVAPVQHGAVPVPWQK